MFSGGAGISLLGNVIRPGPAGSGYFIYGPKNKIRIFLRLKILPARAIRIFFLKNRNRRKTHDGEKYQQSIVHPIIG